MSIKEIVKNLCPPILWKLARNCFYKVGVLSPPLLHNYRREFFEEMKKNPIKQLHFEIHVCEHCNLNCKGCGHFSCIAEEEYLDTNIFEKDCARLSFLLNRQIQYIDLMGGEPLLHPYISKICEIARKYFDGPVRIITNGILLQKMDESFWDCLHRNKIDIIVSKYPIKLDYTGLVSLANNHGVELNCRGKSGETDWFKSMPDMKGGKDRYRRYLQCLSNQYKTSCIFLENGKLSHCGNPFWYRHFNKCFNQAVPTNKKDYIDIYKVNNLQDILDFLSKPIPWCSHCNISTVSDWGISKKSIDEWVS